MQIKLKDHNFQIKIQIFLPLLISIILIGAVAIILLGNDGEMIIAHSANISIIFLIMPTLFFGLLQFILLLTIIIGISRLYNKFPNFFRMTQSYVYTIGAYILILCKQIVQPIILIKMWLASIYRFFSYFTPKNQKSSPK